MQPAEPLLGWWKPAAQSRQPTSGIDAASRCLPAGHAVHTSWPVGDALRSKNEPLGQMVPGDSSAAGLVLVHDARYGAERVPAGHGRQSLCLATGWNMPLPQKKHVASPSTSTPCLPAGQSKQCARWVCLDSAK